MALAKLKKDELICVAEELDLKVPEGAKIVNLKRLIEESDIYKNNLDEVQNIISSVLEEKKVKADRELEEKKARADREKFEIETKLNREKFEMETKLELERIKLAQLNKEVEIANIKKQTGENNVSSSESESSHQTLENLVKSIKTLTIAVPTKAESFNLFFRSLEKAFKTKCVREEFKAEILLNILGEKVNNLLVYVSEDELNNYERLKLLVLKELQPTPQECLNNFRRSQKLPSETYVQFASRLNASFEYYCELRKTSDFKTLCKLIVSDKIYSTLDRDLMSHIGIKQGETWFEPQELGRECDIFLSSKGKNKESNFLSKQCTGNEKKWFDSEKNKNRNERSGKNFSNVFLSEMKSSKCLLCNNNECHPLHACSKFKALTINERVDFIKMNNLCFKCFLPNCNVKRCKFRNCFCSKPHNSLIHFPREQNVASMAVGNVSVSAPVQQSQIGREQLVATSFLNNNKSKTVLLSTARGFIRDKYSGHHEVRFLADSGSQSNLISSDCVQRLRLKQKKINVTISCVNDSSMRVDGYVTLTLCNKEKSFERELDFLVVRKITDLVPRKQIDVSGDIPDNIQLSDCKFNLPGKIDLLLGTEIFFEIMRPNQIRGKNSQLIFQDTVFGYIVSGCLNEKDDNKTYCGLVKDQNLNETLKSFWEIEKVEHIVRKNKEALICEEHFKRTYYRDRDGKYVVTMPLKDNPECLGNSRDIALARLKSLWTRLAKDQNYLKLYRDFLNEYLELDHMKEVNEQCEPNVTFYLPHHGVYNPHKPTTKLRVVFNGSSRSSEGHSLNSLQYNGGVIQEDVFAIMARFRKHIFAFTADVQKMYRMIRINPEQQCLQRILWKDNASDSPKTFELLTVTYGMVCASFLATRVLQQLSVDEEKDFPAAAPVVREDVYMDDVLSGSQTLLEAKDLQRQLIGMMDRGGMKLHKWCGNHPELSQNSDGSYDFSDSGETKTLGVLWNPVTDCFSFKVSVIRQSSYTKRCVLSTIAKIFDPLGLLGPLVSKAKMFLQNLWRLNIDWDETLPEPHAFEWDNFLASLQGAYNFNIERCIVVENATVLEIHGFSDASERCYGAVIYCKSINSKGDTAVKLVASKSRVAPIKSLTIPRLELCGALLLAQLMKRVLVSLKLDVHKVYLYTDSTIVLSWIQKEPADLKQFVASRVATIQELTYIPQWRHVVSQENPADLISRGLEPEKFIQNELWWEGPPFLRHDLPVLPQPPVMVLDDDDYCAELKKVTINLMTVNSDSNFFENLINRTNDFVKLIHILVYIFRFINNSRKNSCKRVSTVTVEEFNVAREVLVRSAQVRHFPQEILLLKKGSAVAPNSKLRFLNPFIDDSGLIRVGGRLCNSNLEYNHKFPIVLPSGDKLTKLIFIYYHQRDLHIGPQGLLNAVRQNFWPLGGRNLARKVVRECIQCFKANPTSLNQIMGNLPPERVQPSSPFCKVGVDFCGPFHIQYKHQRKGNLQKMYVCIFVCMATKAVHLEIVSDLTSEALIATLKRFFSRRGKSNVIFSDNATNFTGASTELKRLLESVASSDQNLTHFLTSEGIVWKFLPPRSPNFGGLWEAGVKSYKYHVKRVVGNSKLTLEEFLTLTTQIEGILNSRPLCPLSPDSESFDALTPGHFLIGRPITSVIEPNLCDISENSCNRWQRVQRMVQTIWKRWQNSYLSHLQNRHKWLFEKDNIVPDTLVLLKDPQLPVCRWSLGRILKTIPGSDGKVRVVLIKTQNGVFKRAISNISVLPVSSD